MSKNRKYVLQKLAQLFDIEKNIKVKNEILDDRRFYKENPSFETMKKLIIKYKI